MIQLLTLLAALQASPPNPSTPPSPVPAASAPAPVEDPAITKVARAQYDAFAAGKIDKSQYSIDIPAQALSQVQAYLSGLGAVKSVNLVQKLSLDAGTVYVYKFTCAKGAVIEQLSLKDGKINGLYFRPAQ